MTSAKRSSSPLSTRSSCLSKRLTILSRRASKSLCGGSCTVRGTGPSPEVSRFHSGSGWLIPSRGGAQRHEMLFRAVAVYAKGTKVYRAGTRHYTMQLSTSVNVADSATFVLCIAFPSYRQCPYGSYFIPAIIPSFMAVSPLLCEHGASASLTPILPDLVSLTAHVYCCPSPARHRPLALRARS